MKDGRLPAFEKIRIPEGGGIIGWDGARLVVPDRPVVGFIEGDGTGPELWRAASLVLDAAVAAAYGGRRAIAWAELYAGDKARRLYGEGVPLPGETIEAIRAFRVAIKGPLATPVGGGARSLNVTMRRELDLYACVRPVRWYPGVSTPTRDPGKLDVVIFRENTEDVYAGIEWPAGSPGAARLCALLSELGHPIDPAVTGLGVKPVSRPASRRLVRAALRHALEHRLPVVTLVHKGNIQKYTEGAFRHWGYELAAEEFPGAFVTEEECARDHGGRVPEGRILLNDRIADDMFQQILLHPAEYRVIATTNLNGDYLSDACAAQVGGLGMAPGANLSDGLALFEATHGTAPKIAGKNVANPGSLILSGVMMLRHLGWGEAADAAERALAACLAEGRATRDIAAGRPGTVELTTSAFARAVADRIGKD